MFPETNDIAFTSSADSFGTKSYLFDFNTGDFVVRDGKLIECDGIDAVKVWIEKILRTEKGRFHIYDNTEYGAHLEDLIIGNSYTVAFIESELKREIEDAILQIPQIRSVSNIKITRGINSLTVELEVKLNDTGGNSITVTV
ncbi:MAG: DUF2634 domain-containing protein [Clostridia bacterium]|nr:DUF2634 domain-containing protein [Clostridia bacterium]